MPGVLQYACEALVSKLTIAFDPGLRYAGVGVFLDSTLVDCFLVRNPEHHLRGPNAWFTMANAVLTGLHAGTTPPGDHNLVFVSEVPQYYRNSGIDPDNLFELVGVVASVAMLVPGEKYTYLPRVWKGNTDKFESNLQIEASLTQAEKEVVDRMNAPRTLRHNAIDAIGIGLYHHMRLVPARKIKEPLTNAKYDAMKALEKTDPQKAEELKTLNAVQMEYYLKNKKRKEVSLAKRMATIAKKKEEKK